MSTDLELTRDAAYLEWAWYADESVGDERVCTAHWGEVPICSSVATHRLWLKCEPMHTADLCIVHVDAVMQQLLAGGYFTCDLHERTVTRIGDVRVEPLRGR